jgi:hypothetical protein
MGGGAVRRFRPTSSTEPWGPWRMTTTDASHAIRCAVSAETQVPPDSSSTTACGGSASEADAPSGASVAGSTCTTT